jgi:hypothetical protein
MYPRLVWNSLSSCLHLLSAGITGIYHHTWPNHFFPDLRMALCRKPPRVSHIRSVIHLYELFFKKFQNGLTYRTFISETNLHDVCRDLKEITMLPPNLQMLGCGQMAVIHSGHRAGHVVSQNGHSPCLRELAMQKERQTITKLINTVIVY